jgi:hypothetical protein
MFPVRHRPLHKRTARQKVSGPHLFVNRNDIPRGRLVAAFAPGFAALAERHAGATGPLASKRERSPPGNAIASNRTRAGRTCVAHSFRPVAPNPVEHLIDIRGADNHNTGLLPIYPFLAWNISLG